MLILHDGNPLVRIRRPWVNHALIALMIAGFIAQTIGTFDWRVFAFFPNQFFTGADGPGIYYGVPGLVTHMFLHGGLLHLVGNGIALWVFGDNIEDAMGHWRYLFFFLVTGVVAAISQGWFGHPFAPMIGASGAVSAVMGAYLLLHPRARILILAFNVVPILAPASIVVGIDLMLNAYMAYNANMLTTPQAAGIAWWAHVGGFVSGLLLVILLKAPDVQLFQAAPTVTTRSMRWLARIVPTLTWPGDRPVADEMAGGTGARRDRWMVFVKALVYILLVFFLMRFIG